MKYSIVIAFIASLASATQVSAETNNSETSKRTEVSETRQPRSSNDGDLNLSAGVGIRNGAFPIIAHLDYTFKYNISAGASASYFRWGYLSYGLSIVSIGGRGSYHYGNHLPIPKELDLYGGLELSYRIILSDEDIIFTEALGGVDVGLHAGARYYVANGFALYAELGNNTSYLQAGVSFKF